MKVLLVYPGIGIMGFAQQESCSGESRWIQHGLALIGANLKSHGHEVELIDMRLLRDWVHVQDELLRTAPDVLGVSASLLDFDAARNVLRYAKTLLPDCVTVMGGILPSIDTEAAAGVDDADYIITGEGEISMVEFVNELDGGHKPMGRVIEGKIPDLDVLPFADRELFDYSRELSCGFAPGQTPPVVTMIAGRGCPYQCRYCQPAERKMFKGKYRMRSVASVIEELNQLRAKYAFNSITWWDDTFTVNRDWIMEFCDAYQAHGFTANIAACCRADIIVKNPAMVARLHEVGLDCFVIGFETGTNRLLDFIGKGTTVEMNLKAADICHRLGIRVFGTFMLGLPTETLEESQATIDMWNQVKPDHGMLFYFNPIPGTHLYDYCAEHDLILREDPFDIERTDMYRPTIKGIDYEALGRIAQGRQ